MTTGKSLIQVLTSMTYRHKQSHVSKATAITDTSVAMSIVIDAEVAPALEEDNWNSRTALKGTRIAVMSMTERILGI